MMQSSWPLTATSPRRCWRRLHPRCAFQVACGSLGRQQSSTTHCQLLLHLQLTSANTSGVFLLHLQQAATCLVALTHVDVQTRIHPKAGLAPVRALSDGVLTDKTAATSVQGVAEVLSAIPYNHNDVYLHTDASLMPRIRATWASLELPRALAVPAQTLQCAAPTGSTVFRGCLPTPLTPL